MSDSCSFGPANNEHPQGSLRDSPSFFVQRASCWYRAFLVKRLDHSNAQVVGYIILALAEMDDSHIPSLRSRVAEHTEHQVLHWMFRGWWDAGRFPPIP